jgi:hypothetical protein
MVLQLGTHALRRALQGIAGAGALLALALAAAPAGAQGTPEQRAACEGDAMRLCQQYVPDVNRITACMSRHRSQLSPACRRYFSGGKKLRSSS